VPQDSPGPIPDASDADLAEQEVPVDPASSSAGVVPSDDPEAPEADRLEQAQEVPFPEDDR